MLLVQEELVKKGLIKPVEQDHLDRWISKIQKLRSNRRRRLERFFTGYEAHKLPYTIEQKTEVTELFESLEEAIEFSQAKNTAKRKVISAIESDNPKLIDLTKGEIQVIQQM